MTFGLVALNQHHLASNFFLLNHHPLRMRKAYNASAKLESIEQTDKIYRSAFLFGKRREVSVYNAPQKLDHRLRMGCVEYLLP